MVSFVLVTVLTSISFAGDWVPFPVDFSTDDQEKPDVYGNKIVWQQQVQGDWDVYGVELSGDGDIFFTVAEWPFSDQLNAAIWENKVVWQDDYFGTWAVYMADTTDPDNVWEREVQIAGIPDVNHEYPAISGNTVVWQEYDDASDSIDIWGTDILVDPNYITHYEVARLDLNQQRPAIYRDNVFWQDDQYDSWDILHADFWEIDYAVIYDLLYDDSADQENPSVWGDIVAWDENIGGDVQIIAADISDPDFPVKFPVCLDDSLQQNPDVGDNLIVWEDYRNDNWDIYGYNLTTKQEFQITTDGADQRYPAVSGDLVVWQDFRDGSWNIYAAYLFGAEVARCTSKLAADINKDCQVNIKDLAMLASQWLICNLDSTELCQY